MGNIADYGTIENDFEQIIKPTIGELRSEAFGYDPLILDDLLPTPAQVITVNSSFPISGNLGSQNWEQAEGLSIDAVDFAAWCQANVGDYSADPIVYAGFLFGDVSEEYRTYFCIEISEVTYTQDGQYIYVYPSGNFTKRTYRTIPGGGGTIMTSRVVFDGWRCRYDIAGFGNNLDHLIVFLKPAEVAGVDLFTIGLLGVNEDNTGSVGDAAVRSYKKSWLVTDAGLDTEEEPEPESGDSPTMGPSAKPKGYGQWDPIKSRRDIGSFDDSSDTIPIDNEPSLNPFNMGFLNAYKITSNAQWQELSAALFPTIDFSQATDIKDWLSYLTQVTFVKNRTEFVLGCLAIPCNVPAGSSMVDVSAGGTKLVYIDSGEAYNVRSYPVSSPFVTVTCGTIAVPKYWANFLDYVGTTAKLFLPGIGFIDLKPEYFNGGTIGVKYRFNVIDGSFMCYVTSSSGVSNLHDSLIGQYSGAMCIRLPITGADYSQIASGLVSAIGAAGAAAATGGATAPLTGATVANLTNTLTAKPHMQNANSYNASSSYMSNKTPYLLIERKTAQFSENYPEEIGFPLNVYTKIKQCKGLTICDNPQINFACTEEEAKEIRAALKEGIIV